MRSFNILFGSLLFISLLIFTNAAKSKNRKPTESKTVEGSGSPPSQTVHSVDDEVVRASGVSPDDEDGDSERFPSSGNPPARPIQAKPTTPSTPTTSKTTTPLELNIEDQTEDDDEEDEDDEDEEENYEEPADEEIKPVMRPIHTIPSTTIMTTTTSAVITTRMPFTTRAPPVVRTTRPPSSPTIEIMSFDSLRPGILAAISGGAVIGLLFVILLVMFIVYRMRKKDEGSYALDEPNPPHYRYSYQKAPTKEFYA